MPIPSLDSISKQVTDGLKSWLPKLTDSGYLTNTPVGKASIAAPILAMPGIGLAAYGIGKLTETKFGKARLKDMEGLPNFPVTAEVNVATKLGKQVGQHADELAPLAMAIPAKLQEYLFTSGKFLVKNKAGETVLKEMMAYDTIIPRLKSYAGEIFKAKTGSSILPEVAAEQGSSKVVAALSDPKYEIPKHLHNDPQAALDHVIKDVGQYEVGKMYNVEGSVASESTSKPLKDGGFANILDNAPVSAPNPEQLAMKSQEVMDPKQAAKLAQATKLANAVGDPKLRTLIVGREEGLKPTEIQKRLADEKVNISRDVVKEYLSGGRLDNILKPLNDAATRKTDSLSTQELQKVVNSQRKLLGLKADDAISELTKAGMTDNYTLNLMRRFMLGTPPSKLTPGKSEPASVKDNLLIVKTELDKLFKIKGK